MANEKNPELDELAFRIYCEHVGTSRGGDKLVIDSYRKAETFISVREKIRNGTMQLEKPDAGLLADCCAPNQPPNFPLNLISQQHGDLVQVNRIAKWLSSNPPTDDEPELVARFNRAFPGYAWPGPEINRARVVFPAFANAVK